MDMVSLTSALAGGIGFEMFFYSLIGSLIHFIYKWIDAINDSKKKGETFYFLNWTTESAPTLLFSIICGLVTVFAISQYFPPINITKSIASGLLAGSAIFNLLPAATNPQMWKAVGEWLVNKFKPK